MSQPVTILFIQKTAGRGGAKNRLLDTLTTLQKNTNCLLHVITSERGEFTERCEALGIALTIHPLPEWRKWVSRLYFPMAMNSLMKQLPFRKADWVISNEMWWAPHAAYVATKLGAQSAAILRDGIADAVKGRKYQLHDNDLILPSSIKIADGLRVDPELGVKTHVLLDAVTLPESVHGSFNKLQSKLASENPGVSSWLLVIGKVQPRKKQTDAVRVLRGLLDSGLSQFGLIIAGDCEPGYMPEMKSVIQECNVQDRVVMLGNYSDIRALFALQPICLLTSLREALPGSVMEALMAGRPCFMYPCEGAEDIFGPHQTRFVSEAFEPNRLIQKMIQMLSDPAFLQSETKALQSRAQELFSIDAHFRSLQKLLKLDISDGVMDSKS